MRVLNVVAKIYGLVAVRKRGGHFLACILFAARILRGLVYVALLIRGFIVYSSSIASKIEDISLLRTRSLQNGTPSSANTSCP